MPLPGLLRASCLLFAIAIPAHPQDAEPLAHFHHVHLNATDAKAAIDFYTTKFESQKAKFAGVADAVLAQKSWLLFTKVATPPKSEITSAIWHIGWGAENMQETYQNQLDSGTRFATPITDISDQGDGKGGNGRFWFAYVDGPDHALIELNTSANHRFGHVHLLSNDPIAASEWYMKEFGLTRRGGAPSREARYRKGRQTAPAVSLMMDNVNVIIYPVGNAKAAFPEAWKGREDLESSKDHVLDHIGFRVTNVDETLLRLKRDGVRILAEPVSILGGKVKYFFIEGPDHIRLEVLEDHTEAR
ncbi:MAG: VOC family protein [Bryobacteraceae bacterium]